MELEEKRMWVKCNECGNVMTADLDNTTCEQCDALDWSEPYEDDD